VTRSLHAPPRGDVLVTPLDIRSAAVDIKDSADTHGNRRKGLVMRNMACRAVAQASLVAATASLDDEQPWPLLLVAGWLTTATDLVLQAEAADAVLV
jgi:hypothetical protein